MKLISLLFCALEALSGESLSVRLPCLCLWEEPLVFVILSVCCSKEVLTFLDFCWCLSRGAPKRRQDLKKRRETSPDANHRCFSRRLAVGRTASCHTLNPYCVARADRISGYLVDGGRHSKRTVRKLSSDTRFRHTPGPHNVRELPRQRDRGPPVSLFWKGIVGPPSTIPSGSTPCPVPNSKRSRIRNQLFESCFSFSGLVLTSRKVGWVVRSGAWHITYFKNSLEAYIRRRSLAGR